MDNLTHSLTGALIGQCGLKRKTGLAMPALVIGANLPDIDAACFFWLEGVGHLALRRGITHGPIAWVLLPLMLAILLYGYDRWQAQRSKRPEARLPVRFGWLYALSFLACLSHPALDWLNSYGIRLLEPFSSEWFYGDALFIIDIWLWVGMGFALSLSRRREKRGGNWRRPAGIGLILAVGYIGSNIVISQSFARMESLDLSYGQAIAAPIPGNPWKRELIFPNPDGRHMIIPRFSGAGPDTTNPVYVGDAYLPACRLTELAKTNEDVAAFLFWSRVPFVEREKNGKLLLRDARFVDSRVGDRFSVPLPRNTCGQFFEYMYKAQQHHTPPRTLSQANSSFVTKEPR